MRRVLIVTVGGLCFGVLELMLSAQAPQPSTATAYANRCASCHAPDMNGAKGPSILTWVRFHVDKEIVDIVRMGHQGVPAQMPDAELRQLLSDMRKLAGTNPAMATGGYTGSRTAALPPESFPPAEPRPDAPGIGGNKPTTIKMADGSSRIGILLGQSLTSAVLLENSNAKFTLLSRESDVYHEKLVAPKRDWLTGPPSEKAREALAALTKGYTMGAFVRAMDPFAAKRVWDLPNPGGEPGILSTASGLVFLPGDGGLLVLDGKTGKLLRSINLGHISSAAPMTYMVAGR